MVTEPKTVRVFDTFDEALRVQQLPFENYRMMHRIVEHIPMARFEEYRSGGVRAVRLDGGHDLKFVSGYVTGFQSKEEGEAASGTTCHPNSKTGVNWMVWLPLNGGRDGGGGTNTQRNRREPSNCPSCGNQMPATGVCDWCD